MARVHLLFAGALFMLNATAQREWRSLFAAHMGSLNAYLRATDTLSWEQRWEDTLDVNDAIAEQLIAALEVPGVPDAAIDSAFADGPFFMAASVDKRLRIFSWDERTGGTFRSNSSVLLVRTDEGTWTTRSSPALESDPFCGTGAAFSAIHVLRSDTASSLYLCMGSVVGCSTCCAEVLVVVGLGREGLDLAYPAFPSPEQEGPGSPCFVLDARCGDLVDLRFDPRKRTVHFTYTTDDLTPVRVAEGERPRPVKGRLRFNGSAFVQE